MLIHPTLEQLRALRLLGALKALQEQQSINGLESLSFEERLGLLLDREITERESRKLNTRLRNASFRHNACFEDIDLHAPRELDKTVVMKLGSCQWLKQHLNCLMTGKTGVGKSWLACAFGHKACLEGYQVRYYRCTALLEALALGRGDGSYSKHMQQLQKTDLLIMDDFGITPLNEGHRRDLLEILEDRFNRRSTLMTSQLPIDKWHDHIGDPTLADAILDRLIHNAYTLPLRGDSMRKRHALVNNDATIDSEATVVPVTPTDRSEIKVTT